MPAIPITFPGVPTAGQPFLSNWIDMSSYRGMKTLKTLILGTPEDTDTGKNDGLRTQLQISAGEDPDTHDQVPVNIGPNNGGKSFSLPIHFSADQFRLQLTGFKAQGDLLIASLGIEFESDVSNSQSGAFLNNELETGTGTLLLGYTLQGVILDTSGGEGFAQLPPAVSADTGQTHTVSRSGANLARIIPAGADTINGQTVASIDLLNDGDSIILSRDSSTDWRIVSWTSHGGSEFGAFINNVLRTTTVNTTIDKTEQGVVADMSVGNVAVALPATGTAAIGETHTISRKGATHTLTVVPNTTNTIDGVNAAITIEGDGDAVILSRESATGWRILSWFRKIGASQTVASAVNSGVLTPEVGCFFTFTASGTKAILIPAGESYKFVSLLVIKNGNGGAGDTMQALNGATPITNAMDLNVATKTLVSPTTIDPAQTLLAGGSTFNLTGVEVTAVDCDVEVRFVRVA